MHKQKKLLENRPFDVFRLINSNVRSFDMQQKKQ